jgi:hypothetical protein
MLVLSVEVELVVLAALALALAVFASPLLEVDARLSKIIGIVYFAETLLMIISPQVLSRF